MSDITTTNLKQLLDEAAPGPWESSASEYGVPEGWDEYWLALHMGYTRLSTMERDDPPPEEAYASLELAALAPELAQEVIRLRGHIEDLVTVMEVKATAGVSQSPATIADCLREEVLGETNE
ncbi:hypothetical protein [Corynebacterium accolens]|uniref:hypothetical protein n=1 Tax=Corynebacterium accolens TaxID=38284 RepID=UPI00266FBBE8|nr:hypothetical protein [Corynebacterium accolens]WKS54931.1 hypothetical protein NLL31_06780 [Corynebacterium accolens]